MLIKLFPKALLEGDGEDWDGPSPLDRIMHCKWRDPELLSFAFQCLIAAGKRWIAFGSLDSAVSHEGLNTHPIDSNCLPGLLHALPKVMHFCNRCAHWEPQAFRDCLRMLNENKQLKSISLVLPEDCLKAIGPLGIQLLNNLIASYRAKMERLELDSKKQEGIVCDALFFVIRNLMMY